MIYEKDGKQQEFTMENYPWQDSTWQFVDSKSKLVQKGNAEPAIKDFILNDENMNDQTQNILTAPGYTFFLFVKDPENARTDNMETLRKLMAKASKLNIPFYVLSSGNKEATDAFKEQNKLYPADYLIVDATANKTAMRSNPGLMLLKDGVIQHKWSFRDYPKDISLNNGSLNLVK